MAMAAAITTIRRRSTLATNKRGNDGADRESGKVVPRYATHLDFRKAQMTDPGRGDDRQTDHYGVADQRHVDADRERPPVVKDGFVVHQSAMVCGHRVFPFVVLLAVDPVVCQVGSADCDWHSPGRLVVDLVHRVTCVDVNFCGKGARFIFQRSENKSGTFVAGHSTNR